MIDLRRLALALFFFAALLLSSGAFAPLWTDTSAHDVAEGGPLLEFVWAAIYATAALLLLPRYKTFAALIAANWPLVLLTFFCAASTAWSEDPAVTLRKSVAILGTTLFGALFALEFEVRSQLRILAAVLASAALASVIAQFWFSARFSPTETAGAAWNGVFSHKNVLGRNMGLGVVAFLSIAKRKLTSVITSVLGIGACFTLIAAAHSQTALVVALAILLLTGAFAVARLPWREALAAAVLSAALLFPTVCFAVANNSRLVTMLGRDATLTGRSHIWTLAAQALTEHAWLGHGYGAFWWIAPRSFQIIALLGYSTPHAHNGFLDIGLQLGIIGLVMFFVSWTDALRRAICRAQASPGCANGWSLLYLSFLLFYSFTESSLLAPNSLLWILYAATCVTLSQTGSESVR